MSIKIFPLLWLSVLAIGVLPIDAHAQEWQLVASGVTSTLNDVQFVSKQVGWAGGDDSTLLKTTDGGISWFPLTLGYAGHIRAVSFIDEQYGWLAVTSLVGGPRTGDAYYTSDGGSTWACSNIGYSIEDIQFSKRDTGWVVGYNHTVFRTTNGGVDWIDKSEGLWGVFYTGSFINGMEGWVAGAYNGHDNFDEEVIWHTTDGGDTWEFQEGINRYGPLKKIHVLPNGVGFAYGWGVGIRTTNRGATWEAGGPGNIATALYALDEEHVYVSRNSPSGTTITMSTDTGKTWNNMLVQSPQLTKGIYLVDEHFGFAVGAAGKIWRFDTTTVGIEDIPAVQDINLVSIYPNPVSAAQQSTMLRYNTGKPGSAQIVIYDMLGRQVYSTAVTNATPGEQQVELPLHGLLPGLYIIQASSTGGKMRAGYTKLIIK